MHGLDRAIRRAEGIGLVVGPPGTGKSLLLAKVAESVRDDFDVAMLSGARICTRRALWQAILAEIGEPYRGIEEGELRIGVVERIRGLAAAGSGLVVLVDEAPTLPTRLIEELRLLTNIPTPLPAVHVVLCGTAELEEILAAARMESLAQRIGPSDFGGRRHVSSREGATLGGQLHAIEPAAEQVPPLVAARDADEVPDDSDMVVIEEDLCDPISGADRSVFPVRVGDYRSLFARLRRGESSR